MDVYESPGHTIHTASGRRVRLPLTAERLRSLMLFVEAMVMIAGCDNTTHHAEAWARAHGVAWGRLARSLRALGAFCDCEIAVNVTDSEL